MRLAASVGALLLCSSSVVPAQILNTPSSKARQTSVPESDRNAQTGPSTPLRPAPVASELAGQTPREIRFRGNTTISSLTLSRLISTEPGQPIDPAQLEKDLTALEAEYHRRGFVLMRALSPDP